MRSFVILFTSALYVFLQLTNAEIDPRCNLPAISRILKNATGRIVSPTFNTGTYPVKQYCTWTIVIPPKFSLSDAQDVYLTLKLDAFDLGETAISDCQGSGDYLLITTQVGNTQRVCNDAGNQHISYRVLANMLGGAVTLQFISDANSTSGEKGFQLTYDFPCALCDHGECGNKTDFGCDCIDGFTGVNCDMRVPEDPCVLSPCLHGGTCVVDYTAEVNYTCTCADGYTGDKCESLVDNCNENACNGHGTCRSLGKIRDCDCYEGFKGTLCDEIDHCAPNPCKNQGTCQSLTTTHVCKCTSGYKGVNCSDIDHCFSDPCLNRAACTSGSDGPLCECATGYKGTTCSEIDRCTFNPCKNGGTCQDNGNGGFKCECAPQHRYRGQTCDELNDGTYCLEGKDPYAGSKIIWSETKMGSYDTQQCPEAEGHAIRHCLVNDTADKDTAYWSQPDLSGCVSERFRAILNDAELLNKAKKVEAESVLNFTSVLTESIENKYNRRLYAGDLAAAVDAVSTVAKIVKKVESNCDKMLDVATGYGNVVGNVVDPGTASVWRFTEEGYLEKQMTSLLTSVELLSKHIAERVSILMTTGRTRRSIKGGNDILFASDNIAFSIQILDRVYNFSNFKYDGDVSDSSIVLPEDVFTRAIQRTSDPYIHVYSAKFSSLSKLLFDTNEKIRETSMTYNLSSSVNSAVISSKVLNVPESAFQDLHDSIRLEFTLQNPELSDILEQNCVFMNMSSTSSEHRWSSQGCLRSANESNATHTVCYCNHLTNFAVLMDVYDIRDTIDELNSKILTYLSFGGGGLSILGCVVSIIVFEFFRLKNERIRIHEQLALTIILVQLFFLVGIDRTQNLYVCKAIAICLHYFLVAMFCWMLVEGTHLYLLLVKVFRTSSSHMKKYVAIGWGVPLVIVGISVGIFHDQYGTGPICWITRNVLLVAFVPAVCLVIVINTVVLMVVMRIMLKSMSKGSKSSVEDRSSIKIGLKAASVLLPLLGLTWTFGFLSVTSKETLIFTYLFTFFNSMQGVFFFVFHCLLSVDVQNAFERRSRRQSHLRMTESSMSKRDRKDSDFDSSVYSFSKTSIKTATTDAHSTLDRKRPYHSSDFTNVTRPQSVTFDDDVFYSPTQSQHGSVSSQVSGTHPNNIAMSQLPLKHTPTDGRRLENISYHREPVLNNANRRTSRNGPESSNGYVFYYGKDNKTPNDLEAYMDFEKNQLYAVVQK